MLVVDLQAMVAVSVMHCSHFLACDTSRVLGQAIRHLVTWVVLSTVRSTSRDVFMTKGIRGYYLL